MNFIKSAAEPFLPPEEAWFFLFSGNHILVTREEENKVSIPFLAYDQVETAGCDELCFLGTFNDKACYCARIPDRPLEGPLRPVNFRGISGKLDAEMFWTAGYARQIHDWNMNFKFCGRCGVLTQKARQEHMRKCPECSLVSYPRISPAILVAVIKEDQILLARGVDFPDKKMFSVLAGFVNPGETLEECVAREIFEETQIRVKEIRYFGSQPWPFPDSLMIGFTAEYDSGEIRIDETEIAEAGWFYADTLPLLPGKMSLSRELIDWFIQAAEDKKPQAELSRI